MTISLDILRGLALYAMIAGAGILWAWGIAPPIQQFGRMMVAVGGGGAVLVLGVIIILANIRIVP